MPNSPYCHTGGGNSVFAGGCLGLNSRGMGATGAPPHAAEAITAALLVLCDFIRQKVECKLTVPSMKWYHAVFIGFVQGVAILPGISRSGSTITGATLCSMKKEDAAEFSFLLSIPAILGGAVLEIPGAVSAGAANINWLSVVLGVAAAAVSGYFAVRFMIKLITKHSLWGFAIYTAILGAFIVLDQNILHLIAW